MVHMKSKRRGRPCIHRTETKQAIDDLLDGRKRTPLENVHGKGPLLLSDIPKECNTSSNTQKKSSSMKPITINMGIDEAGRGPVLGPMVYAAAYWSTDKDDRDHTDHHDEPSSSSKSDPRSLFRDSKTLTEERRSTLFQSILDCPSIGFAVRVLHASEISRNMLQSRPYNLNQMSHDAVIEMIDAVLQSKKVQIDTCYVDTVGIPEHYRRKLEHAFEGQGIRFVVEKKADAKYATCSAASVIAKVTRDRIVQDWVWSEQSLRKEENVLKGEHDCDYGSGYPSDPKCKTWMENNLMDPVFGFPDIVRFSWGPAKLALQKRATIIDWGEEDEEENNDGYQQCSVTEFFTKNGTKKRKRMDVFDQLGLDVVESIVNT